MMNMSKRTAIFGALAAGILTLVTGAQAQQAWKPDRAVEIIIGTSPGGPQDQMGRLLLKALQDGRGFEVPVTVVNRPGGNQTLSRLYVSQHPGDAHYFDIATPSLTGNYVMGVSPLKHTDFTPIALLTHEYTTLTVKADSPIRNVADLVERLKKDPESVSIGVSNLGGTSHLTVAVAAKSAGTVSSATTTTSDGPAKAEGMEWDPADVQAYYRTLTDYRVAGVLYGHTHGRNIFRWDGTAKAAKEGIATFNCDNSSHFGGTQQAILYFEIWRDRVLVREYQTRDAWETASWTPQVWI